MFSTISKFFDKSTVDQILIIKVFFYLTYARFKLTFFPFRKIANTLGTVNQESTKVPDFLPDSYLAKLKQFILSIGQHIPLLKSCFVQALCAHYIIKGKGLEHTIYFGIHRDKKTKFSAHAWLRVGQHILTGEPEHEKFIVISSYTHHRIK